jgi:hypothetical protein
MPVSLKNLQQRRKTIPVAYADSTLEITYNPAAITSNTLKALLSDDGDENKLIQNIMLFLLDWDVEDDGEKVTITPELLAELPIDLLVAMSEAINKDVQPGESKGATSKGGSFSPA